LQRYFPCRLPWAGIPSWRSSQDREFLPFHTDSLFSWAGRCACTSQRPCVWPSKNHDYRARGGCIPPDCWNTCPAAQRPQTRSASDCSISSNDYYYRLNWRWGRLDIIALPTGIPWESRPRRCSQTKPWAQWGPYRTICNPTNARIYPLAKVSPIHQWQTFRNYSQP
jgi:hypothetical protein